MALFEGFARQSVEVGEGAIRCVTGGDGPPVLLLHGFPQSLALWAKVAPLLAGQRTVVCADLRGYGDSFKPPPSPDAANYSFRAMAHDQVALMRRLGHETFCVIGHDRGGRVAHRMALDAPQAVTRLAVLDIVPTHAAFMRTDRALAQAYWHWFFLSQPAPFPERLIEADPDFFFETSMLGWGRAKIGDFDAEMVAEYRRCWRDTAMIRGACADYRAAPGVDFAHDSADLATRVACPVLALWGTRGVIHGLFDVEAEWRARCDFVTAQTIDAGHFLVDEQPVKVAAILRAFLDA